MDDWIGPTFFASGLIVSLGINFALSSSLNEMKDDAVERGYALHCPDDGRWVWKGECKEDE